MELFFCFWIFLAAGVLINIICRSLCRKDLYGQPNDIRKVDEAQTA
jgi:hypothetical protein